MKVIKQALCLGLLAGQAYVAAGDKAAWRSEQIRERAGVIDPAAQRRRIGVAAEEYVPVAAIPCEKNMLNRLSQDILGGELLPYLRVDDIVRLGIALGRRGKELRNTIHTHMQTKLAPLITTYGKNTVFVPPAHNDQRPEAPLLRAVLKKPIWIRYLMYCLNQDPLQARCDSGRSCLYSALFNRQRSIAWALLEAVKRDAEMSDALIAMTTPADWTVLHLAAQAGWEREMAALLAAVHDPAVLFLQTNMGATILHLAVAGERRRIVSMILEALPTRELRCALVALPNEAGYTAFHIAQAAGSRDFIKMLEEYA